MVNRIEKENELYVKVVQIVKELLGEEQDFNWDDSLSEKGLNSFTSIRLIVKLEETFEIEFDDSELILENFHSIRSIVARIENKIEVLDL